MSGQGSPFWQFSLRLYRAPQVAEACLVLQDQCGIDVNLLLYLLWQAQQGHRLTVAEVGALEVKVGPWRERAVVPLRELRRALKSPPDLLDPAAADAFRNRIKAVELEAERLQQEAMAMLPVGATTEPDHAAAARANVAAYGSMLGVTLPQAAVEPVLAALASMQAG